MDQVTDLTGWNLVLGFISATFVLPVIQQPRWTARQRAVVTFVYSIVVSVVTTGSVAGFDGWHDVRSAAAGIVVVLVSAVGTYKGFAKPSGIAPAIESATSPTPARA